MTNDDAIKVLKTIAATVEREHPLDWQGAIEKAIESLETEIVHCKDCKYFSMTTICMPYACWRGGNKLWGETGEHASHTICTSVESPEHYCSYGERGSWEPPSLTKIER